MKMNTIKYIVLPLFAGMLGSANAQLLDTLTIDFNNVSALVGDGGSVFNDESTGKAAYEVPKGSGKTTIYSLSGWFGALDLNSQLHLAYNKFGSGTISSGPMADSMYYDSAVYLNQYSSSIWRVTDAEIQNHITNYATLGYITPQSILDWPGNGDVSIGVAPQLAPFVDVNGDWLYNPSDGDYPAIRGDEAVYVIMNDHYNDTSIMNMSMGIEIHMMVYQYLDGSFLDNTTFLNYRVYNRSLNDYAQYRQSIYADMDIGNYSDDYVGCDTTNHVAYAYNGDAFDEDNGGAIGYGANPPCQGVVCLSHDMKGVTHFTNASGYPHTDPTSPFEYWNFMNGLWADGSPMVVGGQGFVGSPGSTTIPTNFIFPSSPSDPSGWSEFYPGGGVGNPPGDRRLVMTIGNDYFPANTSICSDYALIFDQSGTNLDNVQNVIDLAGTLRSQYTSQNGYPCFSSQFNALNKIDAPIEFSLFPNPSTGAITVSLPSTEDEVSIQILDLSGRVVFNSVFHNTDEIQINLNETSGVYIVKTEINSYSSIKRLILQ